jgi:hypothetical protein
LKKILSTIILALFVYNSIGFLAIHPLISLYFKSLGFQEAENNSENKRIELIVLRKEDILSKKINYERISSSELRLNGNLYDIVKEVEKDSNIFLYCINDKREESLLKEFCKKIDDNVANRKQRNSTYNVFKKSITEPVSYLTIIEADANQLTYSKHYVENYSFVWKEVITPPPQKIISIT